MNNSRTFYRNAVTFSLILLNFIFIFNYKIFIGLLILLLVLLEKEEYHLEKVQKFFLKLIPVSFYSFNLLDIFLANPRVSSIFWDMQDFLHYLNCNLNSEITHNYKYINEEKGCVDSIGYGPLADLIRINFDIWLGTLIVFAIFGSLCIFVNFKNNKNILLITIFLLSPSFNFLINSLNADIFVFIFFVYLFNKKSLRLSFLDLTLMTILIQLKAYPIGLLGGYTLYYLLQKNINFTEKLRVIVFLFLNSVSLIYFFLYLRSFIPDPLSYTRTFGIYHDYLLITNIVGYEEVKLIGIVALVFGVIIYLLKPSFIVNFSLNEITNDLLRKKYFIFFPTALLINLFQNWGYKFIFNFFLIYIIYVSSNKVNKSFLLTLVLTQTTYYLIGYGFVNNYINNFFLINSKLFFYLFLAQFIYYYFLSFKKLISNYNF